MTSDEYRRCKSCGKQYDLGVNPDWDEYLKTWFPLVVWHCKDCVRLGKVSFRDQSRLFWKHPDLLAEEETQLLLMARRSG